MIDLVLRAATKENLATWLMALNLIDADNAPREGLELAWWGESGKVMATLPTYDVNGNILTAATYLPGVVLIARIHSGYFAEDRIQDGFEQWQRSKLAKWVKANGTAGVVGGISYHEVLAGGVAVRLFRFEDVTTYLATKGLPGHEWAGGNRS